MCELLGICEESPVQVILVQRHSINGSNGTGSTQAMLY